MKSSYLDMDTRYLEVDMTLEMNPMYLLVESRYRDG